MLVSPLDFIKIGGEITIAIQTKNGRSLKSETIIGILVACDYDREKKLLRSITIDQIVDLQAYRNGGKPFYRRHFDYPTCTQLTKGI